MNAGLDGSGGLLGDMLPDFTALDTDANGQITTEEVDAARAARFATADANIDGGLPADEIITRIEARRAEMLAARAQWMIEQKDTNADGLLQAGELQDARAPRTAVMTPAARLADELGRGADRDDHGGDHRDDTSGD